MVKGSFYLFDGSNMYQTCQHLKSIITCSLALCVVCLGTYFQ